jgi:coenzyme F420-0:L-glutamate ligase/coenzyme F420-1:gamma-L-glutamate ligase
VCANAGVDQSNVGGERVTLLPPDPDRSAAQLRQALEAGAGVRLGLIISDTFGRAWREGQTNIAVGVSGVEALRHFEGQLDPTGYELRVTLLATADELASAAELVMGKIDRVPVAVVRGLSRALGNGTAHELIRPAANDLFR